MTDEELDALLSWDGHPRVIARAVESEARRRAFAEAVEIVRDTKGTGRVWMLLDVVLDLERKAKEDEHGD